MKIKAGKQSDWEKIQEVNSEDPYSNRCVTYAEDWANLMEKQLAKGRSVEDCAESTATKADTDGITGFMYGAACNILAGVWEHGESLRIWHNKKYNPNYNGSGTINPAILTVNNI
jgi:hypothetical protein